MGEVSTIGLDIAKSVFQLLWAKRPELVSLSMAWVKFQWSTVCREAAARDVQTEPVDTNDLEIVATHSNCPMLIGLAMAGPQAYGVA